MTNHKKNTLLHTSKTLLLIAVIAWGIINFASGFSGDMRVATIQREPFSMVDEAGNMYGFSIELWEHVSRKIGVANIKYQPTHTVFSEMLQSVASGNVDIAVANISITSQREKVMDFSHPIFDSGLVMLIRDQGSNNHLYVWAKKNETMIINIVSLIVLGLVYLLIYRNHKRARNQIISYGLPTAIIIFIIFSQIYLQKNNLSLIPSNGIQTYKQLETKMVGAAKGTTMSSFLEKKGISYKAYNDFSDSIQGLKNHEVDVIIGSAATSQYYVTHGGKGVVKITGELFAPDKIAFALQQDHILLEEINTALLELKAQGVVQALTMKYFGK